MKSIAITLLALFGLLLPCVPARAATYPTGFDETALATGLTAPTMVDWAPDGRMFVAEKGGVLKVVPAGGGTPRTVLDISDEVNSAWDRGLLGLAVDTNFATNGYVYLLYSREIRPLTPDSTDATVSRLTRITVGADNRAGAETVLLGKDEPDIAANTYHPCPAPSNSSDCIPSEEVSHSIGTVRSAPDGTLYVGSGDASDYGRVDPYALETMDDRTYRGKIVHIDRNGRGLPGHAFCPTDANLDHVCTKVHAKGFRNPFRFQLMPDGRLAVADVGWSTYEELDIVPAAGRNYGWPCYEAGSRTPGYDALQACQDLYAANTASPPAHSYDHDQGAAILAGPVYAGNEYPASYRGSLFIGDYVGGFVRRVQVSGTGAVSNVQPFATGWTSVALEEAPNGDLVHVDFGDGSAGTGAVRQIFYSPGNAKPVARASANPTHGDPPLAVTFNASASTDADGDPLTYRWDFGDGTTGTGATPSHTYTTAGEYTATVTADDGRGRTDSATVSVRVGNTPPPVPTITQPADEALYRDGDQMVLKGAVTDAEDGPLTGTALSWHVILHHSTSHTHPVHDGTGVQTSFTTVSDHDSDSWYDVTLTARDSRGATSSRTIQLRPRTAPLEIRSVPDGAPISWAGRESAVARSYDAAVGFESTASAPESFTRDGREYRFDSWSDGGARSHDVTMPDAPLALEARYREVTAPAATPPATAAPGDTGGDSRPRDRRGPAITLPGRRLTTASPATLKGVGTDSAGIRRVEVALSTAGAKRCRWWSSPARRLGSGARSCTKPAWMRAGLSGKGRRIVWRATPWRRPVKGSWRLWVRATDRMGNRRTVKAPLVVTAKPKAVAGWQAAAHPTLGLCLLPPA